MLLDALLWGTQMLCTENCWRHLSVLPSLYVIQLFFLDCTMLADNIWSRFLARLFRLFFPGFFDVSKLVIL